MIEAELCRLMSAMNLRHDEEPCAIRPGGKRHPANGAERVPAYFFPMMLYRNGCR